MVGERVRATGTIRKAQGSKIIVVTTYQVIEENFGEEAARGEFLSGQNRIGDGLLQGKE